MNVAGYSSAGELTPRMLDVLRAGARGSSVEATARELGVSRATVRTVRAAARARLGCSTTAAAIVEAYRRGVL